VVEHRAKFARVKPVFKEVTLNLFSPMASERATILVYFEE
jgi:hypothetical protein